MSQIKTEELNKSLRDADEKLHVINAQMTAMNEIRGKIESGSNIKEIEEYIRQFLAMAVKTKANVLKSIEDLHLQLAERHMKLTKNWEFIHIGQSDDKKS